MIELRHIVKDFGTGDAAVHALRDISLTVEDGEIFGIIGLSGAGKSTLVRCINLLERPTSGSVIVDGRDLTSMTDRELRTARKSISMIFQSFNLLMQRSVLANVCFPMELAGIKKEDARRRAMEPAFRRTEAARSHSPRARQRPEGPAVRRGHLRPGPENHPFHPGSAQKAQPGAGRHGGGHHP